MTETDQVKKAAATLGRLGGSKKSPAKTRAARENGRRGGRPARNEIEEAAREAVEVWNEPVEFSPDQIGEHASKLKQAMQKLAEALRSKK